MEQPQMNLSVVTIENPDELNFILGHSHFIKTVEDIHEAIVCTVPGAKFGRCVLRGIHGLSGPFQRNR